MSRRKTRIVAKGYSQIEGIDYMDSFTPVAHLESMHTVLSIAASLDWEIHQFDVKTEFLHGDLMEDIYMEQPEGQKARGKETWVCKLHKLLYGLQQAGRCWYMRLYDEIHRAGFTRVSVDHSVFVKQSSKGVRVLVYVSISFVHSDCVISAGVGFMVASSAVASHELDL